MEAKTHLELILSARTISPSSTFIDSLENKIKESIHSQKAVRIIKIKKVIAKVSFAASVLIAIAIYWFYSSEITLRTEFGATRSLTLPDGTRVTLNAASSLTYPRAMAWGKERIVKLKGEAFFDVPSSKRPLFLGIKKVERDVFRVQAEQLEIQVLGTEFNVKSRRGAMEVLLVTGKIKVRGPQMVQILYPNELLAEVAGSYKKIAASPGQHTAWLQHKMLVHNTSLKTILENFEDVFGKKVILSDPALGSKTIDGTISMENEENTLFILSSITNCQVSRQGNYIYFTPIH